MYQPFGIQSAQDLESLQLAVLQNLQAIAVQINSPEVSGHSVLSAVPDRPQRGDTAWFIAGVIDPVAGLGQYMGAAWVRV
jgi:hypothetical protein